MSLPDFLGFFSIPGLKPPLGQHWSWWVLWSLWAGFWLGIVVLAGVFLVGVIAG
jgi:hypothetical protein